jgi:hypothetical protein
MAEVSPTPKRKRTANPEPAVMRISIERATALLRTRQQRATVETNDQEDQALHCIIDQGMLQNGYPSVSHSHTEANIQVSHLVLRVEKGIVPIRAERETASHLCHNKRCIRAEHIIIESIGQNGRRNGCLAFVACSDCTIRVNACGHEPHCILPFPRE